MNLTRRNKGDGQGEVNFFEKGALSTMEIVTVKEVAEFLRVKEKTVYQWAEMGQIPSLKINGSLRFDLDEIKAWVAGCKQQLANSYNPITKLEARKKGGRRN